MTLAAQRAAAQLLHRPSKPRHPADVLRAIAGAQAQDPRQGRLALRARNAALVAADVDRARNEERSVVRAWAMRTTMHLLAADDAAWMVPLWEPVIQAEARRRLAHFGVDARAQDRALAAIRRLLAAGEPRTREEIVAAVENLGTGVTVQVRTHLFRLLMAEGEACAGPDRGSQATVIRLEAWLGERPAHDREAALRELAVRYLRAFGPATEADFAGWAGLPLRDVRAGLAGIADRIAEERPDGVTEPLLRLKGSRPRARGSYVRLLPGFDTYLMGHRDANFMATPAQWKRILPGGGILRPVIIRDGVAIGTWHQRRQGKRLSVRLEPFAAFDDDTRAAIEAELADLARFEGATVKLEEAGGDPK
jgi:hypothetical protein